MTQALDNYLVGNSSSGGTFQAITEQELCDDDDQALYVEDSNGIKSKAIRCVEKSATEKMLDADTKKLFYIVESTGHSHASDNHSLQTKIVAGISIEGPEGTVLYTQ